jgi:hypothetical protein
MDIFSSAYDKASYYLSKAKAVKANAAKRVRIEQPLIDLRDEDPGTSSRIIFYPSAFSDASMIQRNALCTS